MAMSGWLPAGALASNPLAWPCVASQSTVAPVSRSHADLTVMKLSSSGPLHMPSTRTCAPLRS